MIVRVLGEGQYDLPDDLLDDLNAQDALLGAALESGDESAIRTALDRLLDIVRSSGAPVAAEVLLPSDVVLPPSGATSDEVRDLLGDEGLVPG